MRACMDECGVIWCVLVCAGVCTWITLPDLLWCVIVIATIGHSIAALRLRPQNFQLVLVDQKKKISYSNHSRTAELKIPES